MTLTLPFGIDISKHQGDNNYTKIKSTTEYVFIKATESWAYVDPKFNANWQGLLGHNRGAYSYVYIGEDPLRQANHLINTVTKAGVNWQYDRLVLDLEKGGHGLSKTEVSRRVLIMMERIKEVTGRYPILYSRASWVNENMLINDPRLINADWWLANFLSNLGYPYYTPEMPPPPMLPNGVSNWLIHQTSSTKKGSDVGVGSYYVDTNRWNGTREDMLSYFGHGGQIPPVDPPEEPEEPEEPVKLFDARVYSWATPYVNIRKYPTLNSKDVGDILPNTIVPVYEDLTDWYGIDSGYVMKKYLEPISAPPPTPPTKLFDARVYSWATPHVNIRKEPKINSKDVGDILPNTIVPVYEDLTDWYGIDSGYVMKRFLEKINPVESGTIINTPPLWQKDPRWSNKLLGNSYLTIGNYGCLLTCFSMIAEVTPDIFNNRLKAVGGFTGANIYWQMVEVAYPNLKYLRAIDCYYTPAPLDIIDSYLNQNISVLVHVDGNPATPQIDQHWIQIVGKVGNDYLANDPLTGKRINFTDVYNDPARWIFRVRVYRNNKGV